MPPNPFQDPGWWIGPNSILGQFGTAAQGAANTLGTAASGALNTAGTAAGGAFQSLTGPVRQLGADLGGEGVWPQNASPEDTAAITQALMGAGMDPTIDPATGQPKDPNAAAILERGHPNC